MPKPKPRFLPFGVVSEGTLSDVDLVSAFSSALSRLHLTLHERRTFRAIYARRHSPADYDVDDLQTILDDHCPPLSYFGTLEGDGACFGVWPILDDEDTPRFSDLADVPRDHRGYFYVVSDHGNVSLYNRTSFGHGYKDHLIWSVV